MSNIWKLEKLASIGQRRAIHFGLQGASIDEAGAEFVSEVWLAMQKVDRERDGATTYLWRRGLGAIKDYIKKGVKEKRKVVSGDARDDDGDSVWDCVGTQGNALETLAEKEQRETLSRVKNVLTDEESALIDAIYSEGKSLSEIAAERGVSKQAIDKQKHKALERMRVAA